MLTLRRSDQRHDGRRGEQAVWLTFCAPAAGAPSSDGFGHLELLNEVRLPPSGTLRAHPQRLIETITYVLDGALVYDDSLGRSGVLQAGEFRRTTAARGVRFRDTNPSPTNWTHLFQVGLRSGGELPPAEEQKRFSAAERRKGLRLIAAVDARSGALRIREDALVYSALLRAGQHLVHDLHSGRRAWLHVVSGEVALGDLILSRGDGVGLTAERSVSFTANQETEVLLIDVA